MGGVIRLLTIQHPTFATATDVSRLMPYKTKNSGIKRIMFKMENENGIIVKYQYAKSVVGKNMSQNSPKCKAAKKTMLNLIITCFGPSLGSSSFAFSVL